MFLEPVGGVQALHYYYTKIYFGNQKYFLRGWILTGYIFEMETIIKNSTGLLAYYGTSPLCRLPVVS